MEHPPQISHVTHVQDTVSSFGLLISYFWFMAGWPMSVWSKCCVLLRKLRFHCWRWFLLQTELTSLQKCSLGHRKKTWLFKLVFACSVQTPSPLLPFHLSLLAKKILKHSEAITACLFWCLASFTAAIRFIVKPQPDLQRDVGATLPVPAVLWKTLFFHFCIDSDFSKGVRYMEYHTLGILVYCMNIIGCTLYNWADDHFFIMNTDRA